MALVVAEVVGTGFGWHVGNGRAGMHPFVRATPPRALRRFEPDHLLVGHGPGVHGPEAAVALHAAHDRARRDIPRFIAALPAILRRF